MDDECQLKPMTKVAGRPRNWKLLRTFKNLVGVHIPSTGGSNPMKPEEISHHGGSKKSCTRVEYFEPLKLSEFGAEHDERTVVKILSDEEVHGGVMHRHSMHSSNACGKVGEVPSSSSETTPLVVPCIVLLYWTFVADHAFLAV